MTPARSRLRASIRKKTFANGYIGRAFKRILAHPKHRPAFALHPLHMPHPHLISVPSLPPPLHSHCTFVALPSFPLPVCARLTLVFVLQMHPSAPGACCLLSSQQQRNPSGMLSGCVLFVYFIFLFICFGFFGLLLV